MRAGGLSIVIFAGIILLVFAVGYANNSAAERNLAEVQLVTARAQAAAITSASMLPWGIMATAMGALGIVSVALCVVVIVTRPRYIAAPPQIIERQILYLPAPGQTRAQVWQGVSRLQLEAPQAIILEQPQKTRAMVVK